MDKEITTATFTVEDSRGIFDAVTVKCRLIVGVGDQIYSAYDYKQKLGYDAAWMGASAVSALAVAGMAVALVLGAVLTFKAWLVMVIFGGVAGVAWSMLAVTYWFEEKVSPWPFGKLFLDRRVERIKKALLRRHIRVEKAKEKKQAKQKRKEQKARQFAKKLMGFYGTVQVDWENRRMS